ncbi:hypothetical protein C7S13_2203 [Burkholderia cepacia]|nr:hypothetical protein [Burkholderia cepacia]
MRRCLLPTTRARPEDRCAMLRRTTSHDGDRATRQCPQ